MIRFDLKAKIKSEMHGGLYRYTSDNPILFTVEFYNLCNKLNIFSDSDKIELLEAINGLRKEPGLFNRRHRDIDKNADNRTEAHDNYVALAASDSLFGLNIAKEIDDYGRNNYYCFNNVNPGCFSVSRLRQPFDIMLYRICANRSLGILGIIGYVHYFLKIVFDIVTFKRDESSGKLLDWIRLDAMSHKLYIKPLKWIWEKNINLRYMDGIADIFGIYHGYDSDLYKLAMEAINAI